MLARRSRCTSSSAVVELGNQAHEGLAPLLDGARPAGRTARRTAPRRSSVAAGRPRCPPGSCGSPSPSGFTSARNSLTAWLIMRSWAGVASRRSDRKRRAWFTRRRGRPRSSAKKSSPPSRSPSLWPCPPRRKRPGPHPRPRRQPGHPPCRRKNRAVSQPARALMMMHPIIFDVLLRGPGFTSRPHCRECPPGVKDDRGAM